jgi:predicted O-methyltransferase YrrM
MSKETWAAVEHYYGNLLAPDDAALEYVLQSSEAAGLPRIQVSALQGKLLHLLALMVAARNILEIGTLAGYSAIWMARALPEDGQLITLEANEKHVQIARDNFARAGTAGKIELRFGKALDTLPQIAAQGRGPFDLVFIDANRSNLPEYFAWSLRLARRGSVIVVDNVVREGGVLNVESSDPDIQGIRRFAEMAAAEKRVSSTVIQTVGSKNYDGFAMLLVTA